MRWTTVRQIMAPVRSILMVSMGVLLFVGTASLADRPINEDKSVPKFGTVVVLSGGSLRTAYFLGMVEEMIAQKQQPDLLLLTCGSSLAGIIANHYGPNPDKWWEFVKGEDPRGNDF